MPGTNDDKTTTTPTGKPGAGFDDEDDEWRHAPVAPKDEKNPLRSIGEAIGDVATGGEVSKTEKGTSGSGGR